MLHQHILINSPEIHLFYIHSLVNHTTELILNINHNIFRSLLSQSKFPRVKNRANET